MIGSMATTWRIMEEQLLRIHPHLQAMKLGHLEGERNVALLRGLSSHWYVNHSLNGMILQVVVHFFSVHPNNSVRHVGQPDD